jgi:Putative MetA-pathway of phenol degradation
MHADRMVVLLRARVVAFAAALLAAILAAPTLHAQTDYYNTDAGRPVLIEDAYALERRGLELQLAPLRFSRARGGLIAFGVEPELAYGVANRTQVELRVPVAYVTGGVSRSAAGISGVDVSVLYNLNTETRIPAFAIAGAVLLPVGRFGPSRAYSSVKGIMTRTFPAFRVHANAQYTFGNTTASNLATPVGAAAQNIEISRWVAGAAIDHTIPLRSLLMTAELYARKALDPADDVEWNSGVGVRYQLAPRWAMDAGLGRTLNGSAQPWYLTAGGAYAIGLPWSAR